jgi:hypothetical protein
MVAVAHKSFDLVRNPGPILDLAARVRRPTLQLKKNVERKGSNMSCGPPVPFRPWRAAAVLLLLAVATAAALTTGQASAAPAPDAPRFKPKCTHLAEFGAMQFPLRPEIDNRFLPMIPGTRTILEGAVDGVPHRVEFTVTDLTKVINGTPVLVIWDTDTSEGELAESELSFFAQDEVGNVWNLGEYPEEYEGGEFVGAPSTWIAGESGAEAGIHMQASPMVSSRQYIQGFAPAVEFFDCAKVVGDAQTVCVQAGCFNDVLVTYESNLAVRGDGIQSKTHAPGVGIVKIGAVDPPTGEVLELVAREQLTSAEMNEARRAALALDERGYQFGEGYGATSPASRLKAN